MIHPDVRLGDTVTSFEQFRGSPIAHGFDAISLCRWKEHFFYYSVMNPMIKISMEPDLHFINIFIATCSQYNKQHQ